MKKVKYDPRKVWVALHSIEYEGSEFLGVAENMAAAKTLCGSDREWRDDQHGKHSFAADGPIAQYNVFETDVIS